MEKWAEGEVGRIISTNSNKTSSAQKRLLNVGSGLFESPPMR